MDTYALTFYTGPVSYRPNLTDKKTVLRLILTELTSWTRPNDKEPRLVPIIVAINKIDKPTADIERAKKMLSTHGVQVEDLGGDIQVVPVSALTGQGVQELAEAIAVQADVLELKADYDGLVEGVVIESCSDISRGKLSTSVVKRGTLRKGSILVAGTTWAKVRAMFDDSGTPVTEAPPSSAVQIIGWRDLPSVGESILQVATEKRAREVVKWREEKLSEEKLKGDEEAIKLKEEEHTAQYRSQLEAKRKLGRYKIRPTGPRQKEIDWTQSSPRVNVILKGDVAGSVEAILDVLDTYDDETNCKMDVVHYGVGPVTENDVELATTFKAVIYAFNVNVPPEVMKRVKKDEIVLKRHNVIYKLIDDLKEIVSSNIPEKEVEEIIGEAKVQQMFMVTEGKKKVAVAGSRCTKGELKRDASFRVLRDGETVFEGKLVSMKHLKNEVGTVKRDVECGLMFEEFPALQAGDAILCYKLVTKPQYTSWDPGF